MKTLYHVTYYRNLPSIEDEGLEPGHGRGIGGEAYDPHREGGVFLTEASGIRYWYSRAEEFAVDRSDDPLEDELVPVVLRVKATDCEEDELGTADAHHPAWKCLEAIPPEEIEVWTGHRWSEDLDLDPSIALDEDGYFLDTYSYQNPLVPRLQSNTRLKNRLVRC
jgi:hypothetical protein